MARRTSAPRSAGRGLGRRELAAREDRVHEGSSASLVASAFSPADPKPDAPRLRVSGFDPVGSDQWKSAHEGAGAFGRGCFLRIRNLYTHHDGETDHEDLEALAALSLLARWIDIAEPVKAEPDSA